MGSSSRRDSARPAQGRCRALTLAHRASLCGATDMAGKAAVVRARQALYGKFKTDIHKLGEFLTGGRLLQLAAACSRGGAVHSLLAGCYSSRASWRWTRSARLYNVARFRQAALRGMLGQRDRGAASDAVSGGSRTVSDLPRVFTPGQQAAPFICATARWSKVAQVVAALTLSLQARGQPDT